MLVELLSRQSKLPVQVATHGSKLRPGCIYVVPPNHDVDFSDSRLRLIKLGEEHRPKPSVDHFFESLANAWGARAVGIILSGTGTDGARGIRAIRSAGGLTFAQDDSSARYDGMPKSAVETGSVDIILTPEAMAREMTSLLGLHRSSGDRQDESLPDGIGPILALVKESTQQDFSQYKPTTIRRRIERQMRFLRLETYPDYLAHLRENPDDVRTLAQDSLISVTTFFRDRDAFDRINQELEKSLAQKTGEQEYRVWVAGCATGEEAYSLAILLTEIIQKLGKRLILKIFATDLDQEAVLEARSGVYSIQDVKDVPPELLEKYFLRRGDAYEAKKSLRESIVFARQDLIQSAPFVKVDLVSCRNVMIYFDSALQKRVFEIFHYSLVPDGLLFLGNSESASEASSLFQPVDKKAKIFRRSDVAPKILPSTFRTPSAPRVGIPVRRPPSASPIAEQAQRLIFSKYGIGGAVVDGDANILHIIGTVAPFLRLPEGHASLNLGSLLPKTVGAEVPILIRKVQRTGEPRRSRAYSVDFGSGPVDFHLDIRALPAENPDGVVHYMVLFEKSERPLPAEPGGSTDGEIEGRVMELEQELLSTREHLQTVIEELGVSNEEMQSLNEELSSTNEELQAANEQLETTNEELQSTNEELTTLNEELMSKSSEIKLINTSLENIQNSISSPLIVVDADLKVLRYNDSATRLFELSPAEIGRDITRISSHCEIPGFHPGLLRTLKSGRAQEILIENFQTVYQLRIMPSLDEDRRIVGAILIFIDNTGLIRAEERLRLSEQRIRAILSSSPNLIWMKDAMGRYLLANEAFAETFGLQHEEIIGRTDREIFEPELANRLRDGDLEVFYKRVPVRREESLTIKGQEGPEERIFLVSRFPVIDEAKQAPYAVGTVASDVTARFRAQEALSQSESRYRAIVEDQAVFVCRTEPDGRLTYVNKAFCTYFGGAPDHYRERQFLSLVDENDRARIEDEIKALDATSPVVQFEHRVSRLGDQRRWIRWIVRAITGPAGEILELQNVGFDVTDYRKETDRLQQKELLFSRILDHTTDFLTVYRVTDDGDFLLEFSNRSAEKTQAFSAAQLYGQSLRSLAEPGKAESILRKFNECLDGKKPVVFDEEMVVPGGSRYLSTTLVPVPDPASGKVDRIAALSRDVSKFRVIQDELRAEKERAESANRSKTDFLASMSHELRTPLNIVLGMSELLEDTGLSDEQKKYVGSIQRSGKVLLTLIEDVLDISKIEEGKLKLDEVYFRLMDLLEDVVDSFQMQARARGVELFFIKDGIQDELVLGDPVRIRQVLTNLLSNAIKFTEHGSVTLTVNARSVGRRMQLEFRVKDTGIGIPPEMHHRIFKKFSQVDSGLSRKYGGTGLGLSISMRLVEMMKGQIGFESRPGSGSTFWFTLTVPFVGDPIPEETLPARPAVDTATGPLRILAVDDNSDSRTLLEVLLNGLGHHAHVVESGLEALQRLEVETYDLVLMDIQMPGADGYETTRRIRSMEGKRDLPVIALTANAMAEDRQKCEQAGMNGFLPKPLERETLRTALKKWSPNAIVRSDTEN